PGAFEDAHGRLDADRDDGEIALQLESHSGDRSFEATGAFEPDDLVAGDELDAGLAMDPCHQQADLWTKDRLERRGTGEYSTDAHFHLRQRGSHLRTDEAHTGDKSTRPGTRGLLDRIAIGHRAELEYARQVGAGDVQAPVLAPCCDQQLRVTDDFPARQLDVAGLDVDAGCGGADPLHTVVVVPVLRVDEPPRKGFLAAEIGLGQGWASERRRGLVADQDDGTGVAILPQRPGRDSAGHSRAQDDDGRLDRLHKREFGALGPPLVANWLDADRDRAGRGPGAGRSW